MKISTFAFALALLFGLIVPVVSEAQTCAKPPTCGANQAISWNGSSWECVNMGGTPAGFLCGLYTNAPGAPGTISCVVNGQAYNPYNSCPSGYTRIGGDYQSPGNRYWYTCAKN